jgi:hypothetical protein
VIQAQTREEHETKKADNALKTNAERRKEQEQRHGIGNAHEEKL